MDVGEWESMYFLLFWFSDLVLRDAGSCFSHLCVILDSTLSRSRALPPYGQPGFDSIIYLENSSSYSASSPRTLSKDQLQVTHEFRLRHTSYHYPSEQLIHYSLDDLQSSQKYSSDQETVSLLCSLRLL